MTRYKYEEQYVEYESFSLREEFELAKDYLLLNNEHANNEVFDAVDEIYHWFCIKTYEVEKLLEENARLKEGTKCRGANSGVIATIATAQEILRAND